MARRSTEPDMDRIITTLEEASKEWDAPVHRGPKDHRTPFQTLVSCIISLRTRDEVTFVSAQRLFERAADPEQMVGLTGPEIAELIHPAGFSKRKGEQILELSQRLLREYQGEVPDEIEELLTFRGVGRKTANLVVTQAFGKPGICVDTHVHRIMNRLGYVSTRGPDQTEMALRAKLPPQHWLRINTLLVAFGQVLCKPISPFCSNCPIEGSCPRVGVERSR